MILEVIVMVKYTVGQIAKAMGINESLFRNYINGSKRPSASRVMDIENFLQKLGKELSETRLL